QYRDQLRLRHYPVRLLDFDFRERELRIVPSSADSPWQHDQRGTLAVMPEGCAGIFDQGLPAPTVSWGCSNHEQISSVVSSRTPAVTISSIALRPPSSVMGLTASTTRSAGKLSLRSASTESRTQYSVATPNATKWQGPRAAIIEAKLGLPATA